MKPWRTRVPVILCTVAAMLGGIVYLNALHNPFVYDDYRTIVDNGSIRTLTDPRSIIFHDVTRPLVNFSYAVDRAVWGLEPWGFHATSVLLHVLNVVLLFLVVWRLVNDRSSAVQTTRATEVAFATAVLFAVHPLMSEAVGYVSGRSEVLCAAFFFLAFLSARRWMRTGGGQWWCLSAALWVAALLTKEIAVMLPFVLFAYDRLLLDGSAVEKRRRLRLHVPFVGLALAAGAGRLAVFVFLERQGRIPVEWRSLLDEARVMWRYVRLFLVPSRQSIFHGVQPIASILDMRSLAAAAAIVLVVTLAWRVRRADPLARLGVIWFFLLMIPSSLIVVLDQGEGMAEHRVYLAGCGLLLVAGSAIGWWFERISRISARTRWLAYATLAVVLLSLAGRTVLRNAIWSDPVRLWQEAVNKAPDSWLPRTLLGEALQTQGRFEEAVASFDVALRLRPDEPLAYLKLGTALAQAGRIAAARETFERLRAIDPQSKVVTIGLGAVAMIAGEPDHARRYFDETLARDPHDVMALQWLALIEEDVAGSPAAALQRCEEIQAVAPGKLSNEDCIRRNRARLAGVQTGRP